MRLIFFPHPSSLKFYFKLCNKILNVFNCSTHNYANSLTVFKIAERYKRLSMRKFFFKKIQHWKNIPFYCNICKFLFLIKQFFPFGDQHEFRFYRLCFVPSIETLFSLAGQLEEKIFDVKNEIRETATGSIQSWFDYDVGSISPGWIFGFNFAETCSAITDNL